MHFNRRLLIFMFGFDVCALDVFHEIARQNARLINTKFIWVSFIIIFTRRIESMSVSNAYMGFI